MYETEIETPVLSLQPLSLYQGFILLLFFSIIQFEGLPILHLTQNIFFYIVKK